jgi:hypothetical protein
VRSRARIREKSVRCGEGRVIRLVGEVDQAS